MSISLHFRDPVNVSENVSDAIAFERIATKIGFFRDIQRDGNVAYMQTGQS